MTLKEMLSQIDDLPNVWGEGALFAFSGLDGPTNVSSGFVATYAAEKYGLLFHTPTRRLLDLTLPIDGEVLAATGDVYAVDTAAGLLCVAWTAWHTLVGLAPQGITVDLRIEDGDAAIAQDDCLVSELPGETLALSKNQECFSLAFGTSAQEAVDRAQVGLAVDLGETVRARLAFYAQLPPVEAHRRLLNKCAGVIKVNTLAPEGAFTRIWSTPDRVPHRWMWLWDSAFHSITMNHISPPTSFALLASVLQTQGDDGMIAHMLRPDGRHSQITQPPILAWGVWENYCWSKDTTSLRWARPRLERYLEWNLTHRDQNSNGLLEWFIEGDPCCRSGESGLDNSPRFDRAALLDVVDFSTFQALDMRYLSLICKVLGETDRATAWWTQAQVMSRAIHALLWDEEKGFYFDRDFDDRPTLSQAVTGFLPLLLDDIPPERVERLVGWLNDPAAFDAPFPVPSIAISAPEWGTDMWRGATWINFDYLIVKGLEKQGRVDEAARLAGKVIAFVEKYYARYGVILEFYDAKDELPPIHCDRKGPYREPYNIRRKMDSIRDYHWSAALTAALLWEGYG
ncbi:MAG: hypothetical protein JW934_20205 [Anaerolineae bacterium]|nr:hypothetical protein [Anaerolineae bacterium]